MGLKIGVPKVRLSRKLLVITLGITVLLGGTGGAALYIGGQKLLGETSHDAAGGLCTEVQTMVLKTPTEHLWLRKYIRMENASGPERVRTALRIAGLLAKTNAVDLIHVSVLDAHGPDKRAGMRGRAIGAEVLIALKPENLPEMKTPAMASYYEGPVNDEGRFYGDKVVVEFDEIRSMMMAMRSVEEKPDCSSPEIPDDGNTTKKNDHGPSKDAKSADHGEKPANDHGEQSKSEQHGAEPAKDDEKAEAHGEQPAKEQSFLDSMLSMVGLGGDEQKPAEDHGDQAKADGHDTQRAKEDMSHAVAEEPVEPAAEDHSEKPVVSEEPAPPAEGDAEASEHEPAKAEDHSEGAKPADEKHVEAEPASHDAKPAKEAAH
jgi:hypothetical protein